MLDLQLLVAYNDRARRESTVEDLSHQLREESLFQEQLDKNGTEFHQEAIFSDDY